MSTEELSSALQENVLALVAFDARHAALVRGAVDWRLFSNPIYRRIAQRSYEFIDQYGEPPGEAHLPDLLEPELNDKEAARRELFERTYLALVATREHLNAEYVLGQLEKFVRQRQLQQGLIKAQAEADRGHLDEAEVTLEEAMRSRLALFDPGLTLRAGLLRLRADEQAAEHTILTGLPELDRRRLGPTRKELHLFVAPPKRGKSWWLVHVGKRALMQGWRVAHLTLEMSADRTVQRYYQALFSVTRRVSPPVKVRRMERDDLGRLTRLTEAEIDERGALEDGRTQRRIGGKLDKLRWAENLMVKEFPTGALTVPALKAYLDALERVHRFVPDLLILDYADLMMLKTDNYRHDLGNLYKDLRGVAVARNVALVTASQSNREGAGSKLVRDVNVAEDWSKIATADCVFTYSQTPEERKIGLARLFVANGRNEEDKFALLMTQAYALGQFCLDSTWMSDSYWPMIESQALSSGGSRADD